MTMIIIDPYPDVLSGTLLVKNNRKIKAYYLSTIVRYAIDLILAYS